MSQFLQFVFAGLTVGAIFGIVALGFTMIYNASGVVNFAQGEFVMLGGMFTVLGINSGLPYFVAGALAILAVSALSVLMFDFAIRPARGAPIFVLIIITIGVSILVRGLAKIAFGAAPQSLPGLFGDEPLRIGGAVIQTQSLFLMFVSVVIFGLLFFLMRKTILGHAVVATSDNPMAAQMVGINVRAMTRLSFALSAGIGALSGILIAPITLVSYDMGTMLALKGFAAAILGGMGNPLGSVVGGLLVGLIEALSAGYVSSQYKDAAAFLIIMLVLFVMPNGLFGKVGNDRV